ncbi:Smt3-specific protease [Tulasnella sp. JGI-2019a]|nr:Smt3-specific protease [Tulasnella sp. JGI-2019a]
MQHLAVNEQKKNPKFVARAGKDQVTSEDLTKLDPQHWLNNEIINFWGEMLRDCSAWHSAEETASAVTLSKGELDQTATGKEELGKFGLPEPLHNIHCFSSFFYTKLKKHGYQVAKLAKWMKHVDVFSKDVILVPVHQQNMHWTLATINFKKKCFEFYDSLGLSGTGVLKVC